MLLSVEKLEAFYGATRALHGVSFELPEGSATTLLGANGAGKTTILRAICGRLRVAGRVVFDGIEITAWATEDIVRLGVAHVPEGRGTFTRQTVEDNLVLGAMTRYDWAGIARDIDHIYAIFPRLRERRYLPAGTLSGGEQQMLAVGRALMLRPRLMLLDEPSFGLAPKVIEELFAAFERIRCENGCSILIVEQNAGLALGLAETAYLLETGSIVMRGTAEEFRAHDGIRQSYLGY